MNQIVKVFVHCANDIIFCQFAELVNMKDKMFASLVHKCKLAKKKLPKTKNRGYIFSMLEFFAICQQLVLTFIYASVAF